MNTFVIIFRQSRPVTDAEKQCRSAETAVWAQRHNAAGHQLDPRILAPDGEVRPATDASAAAARSAPAEAWPITALLFLEARNLSEALGVAESHPGRHYGASIEVRPWAAPVAAAQPTTPPAPAPASVSGAR